MKGPIRFAALSLLLAAAACGGDGESADQAAATDTGSVGASAADTGGMKGMEGMSMDGMEGGMDEAMRSHMQSMQGATGDSLMAMMPMHRQMAANMLSRMNREMGEMNMPGDAAWTAVVDSVRQDLARMPEMSASELQSFMPAHEGRLNRLSEMHRTMMANMDM
jgi:hypothetical protein